MKTVYNFRPFGEHRTTNGKILRKGLLFRSGDLDKIKRKDLKTIEVFGIKTIIDLRAESEYRKKVEGIEGIVRHSIPVDLEPLTKKKLKPLLYKKNVEKQIVGALDSIYNEMLDYFSEPIQRIFKILENEDAYPVLIHCRAGKDRTGFLSALILLLVGIEQESIVADYLFSNNHLIPVVKKKLSYLKMVTLSIFPTNNIVTALTVKEQFLETVIKNLQDQYEGVEGYLKSCGVSAKSMEIMKCILLEDGA